MIESLFLISQMEYLLNTNIRSSILRVIFANLFSRIITCYFAEEQYVFSAKQLQLHISSLSFIMFRKLVYKLNSNSCFFLEC